METTAAPPEKQPASTDDALDFIVRTVKEESHKLITRNTAKKVYEGIFAMAVQETRQHGFFKLPYGFGQFYLRVLGLGKDVKPRKLPNGTYVTRTPRPTMRYKPGATVQALLEGRQPATARPRSEKEISNLRRHPVR
jgi:hypothetical protein